MTPLPRTPLLAALGALALVLPAGAQDLYLGSRTTQVTRNDPLDGAGALVGVCGGIVQSMAELGGEVFIGDVSGNVYRHVPATGAFGYAFTSSNDASALVADGGDLLVGGSDGSILRYDPATGTQKGSLSLGSGFPVNAMVLTGGSLIVGSDFGLIQSGDPVTGGFQFWASCGNDINAMTTDGNQLFLADEGASIWRFEVVTKGLIESYPAGSQGLSLALVGGDLVVGCEDGVVRRLQHYGGALKGSFAAGFPVDALTVLTAPEPGLAYCFGSVCPCGNNDGENGCENSTGFGSGLLATGTASVVADDLVLSVYDLPKGSIARYYMGLLQNNKPFGDGLLCAGGSGYPTFRFGAGWTGPQGLLRLGPGIGAYAQQNFGLPGAIVAGGTWNFQAWYRDPAGPCGSGFNTSSAYQVTFVP